MQALAEGVMDEGRGVGGGAEGPRTGPDVVARSKAIAGTEAVAARTDAATARRAARAELGDRIAEQAYHLDAAMHRLLADVRAFDEAGYWADDGAISCAAWLSWRVGWTPGAGREHVRVARALATLPRIDDALRDGRLSYSKVRAITRVATPATEEALLVDALATTAAQLELICRKFAAVRRHATLSPEELRARRTVTRRERADGMVVIEAVLPADEAALVMAAIEREAARRDVPATEDPVADVPAADVPAETWPLAASGPTADVPAETRPRAASGPTTDVPAETRPRAADVAAGPRPAPADRADGLVALAQAALRGDAPGRAPFEVVLTIPHAAIAGGSPEGALDAVGTFADGTCVSAETARRLACDCGVVHLHEDAAGQPLSVGRRTRTVPAAPARALAQRDPTCRFPGCTNRRYLDGHHIVHWAHGGETSLTNTLRLCNHHHRHVHEHGYRIEWLDGQPAFFRDGRRVLAEPPRAVRAALGWPTVRAASAEVGVAVDARTGQCGWDGRPVQYGLVVDDLAYLELRHPRTDAPPS